MPGEDANTCESHNRTSRTAETYQTQSDPCISPPKTTRSKTSSTLVFVAFAVLLLTQRKSSHDLILCACVVTPLFLTAHGGLVKTQGEQRPIHPHLT